MADTNNLNAAIDLYNWNIKISGEMLNLIAITEIVLRNALDKQLTIKYPSTTLGWTDLIPLDARGKQDVLTATKTAHSKRNSPNKDDVICELNFGFWRYIISKRYLTRLWVNCLVNAFPNSRVDSLTTQKIVEHSVSQLHKVRNRIAHHEPIHRRNLLEDYNSAMSVMNLVHPQAGLWLAQESNLPALIAQRPK